MNTFYKTLSATAIGLACFAGPIRGVQAEDIKAGSVTISQVWARPAPVGSNVMAGFMTLTNTGADDDRLMKATSDISQSTQIHEIIVEADVVKMKEMTEGLPVPAGKTVMLKPKSFHIMFIGVKSLPKVGEHFSGTLTFEKAGTVKIDYLVEDRGTGMSQ